MLESAGVGHHGQSSTHTQTCIYAQLSGLNRNAKRVDILDDPKNRLIKVYYEMVGWFKPQHTLTEQVGGHAATGY